MPDLKNYGEFKRILEQRYSELREEIRQELLKSDEQHFIDLAGQVHDLQDESVADLLVDLDLAILDMHIEEIRDIDAALIRIASGSYGECTDCSTAIDEKRMRAWPTAKRCQPCQTRYESSHAVPAHPSM
jgi:RNA polymerase-binding transcription factor DksA